MAKLRVGLIGCGKIARVAHAPGLSEMKKVAITALFDMSKKAVDTIAKEFATDALICDSVEELLSSDVDSVVISTPNHTHCELALQALRAGKHVLVEKPMAASLSEAGRMIAAAKRRGLTLQVNQTLRFTPPYVAIKHAIEKGKIGTPLHIRCIRASGSTPNKGWSPGADWFMSKEARGGIIMDIGVHMADVMRWYFGDIAKLRSINQTKSGNYDVPDNSTTLFDFKNGATGVLELSWTTPAGGGLLEVYGTKGTIRMGFGSDGPEVSKASGGFKALKVPKTRDSHKCFWDAILKDEPTPVSGEVGRGALACCVAMEQSGRDNRDVKPRS
ncbi:MAG: Gfo/Idh/MocA family oxidoreductase [Kiritimatiellaeota bacterium]|nr:Gfo/Idh/MocA family oxidoreductase [Kiritimatiellota bacterium]